MVNRFGCFVDISRVVVNADPYDKKATAYNLNYGRFVNRPYDMLVILSVSEES